MIIAILFAATTTEHLLANYFPGRISFSPHSCPVNEVLSFPFCTWGSQTLSNLLSDPVASKPKCD